MSGRSLLQCKPSTIHYQLLINQHFQWIMDNYQLFINRRSPSCRL
ncbi:MAG: hypothetical protein VKL42_00970 [Snowella sp.]|nr:hypothetical protein [Snowella sp.]